MSERRELWDAAWRALSVGASDAGHAMHLVALGSVTGQGHPALRYVVLRAADPEAAWLEVHTDLASSKVGEVQGPGGAALLAWDPQTKLQVRARGVVELRTADAVRGLWEGVPEESRLSYGVAPPPGAPIAAATAYDKTPKFARFAVLRLVIAEADVVDLNPPHRRALYLREDGFAGDWRAP